LIWKAWGTRKKVREHITANYTPMAKKKIVVDMRSIVVSQIPVGFLWLDLIFEKSKNSRMNNIGTGGDWGPIAGFAFQGRKFMWPSAVPIVAQMMVTGGEAR